MLGSGYVSRVCFEVCFGVCFGGMFRGIMSYFACNFRGMLRGMFRGYVSGYVTGYVSRVCNPCALLKPEPPQKNTNPYVYFKLCAYLHTQTAGSARIPLESSSAARGKEYFPPVRQEQLVSMSAGFTP